MRKGNDIFVSEAHTIIFELSTGINFTNPLALSANAQAHKVWCERYHSVSPIKLLPTLPVNTTRSYAQLLCSMLSAVCKKDQHRSTAAKAAHKMMMKLTPGGIPHYDFSQEDCTM